MTPNDTAPTSLIEHAMDLDMPDYLSPLPPQEQARRAFMETEMRKHRKGFITFGTFLLEIQQDRLYRSTHATFELYLRDVWDISRQMGYLLMSSGDLADKVNALLEEHEQPIQNERQARALKPLLAAGYDIENVVRVWRHILKLCEHRSPRSAQIKEVVGRILTPPDEADAEPENVNHGLHSGGQTGQTGQNEAYRRDVEQQFNGGQGGEQGEQKDYLDYNEWRKDYEEQDSTPTPQDSSPPAADTTQASRAGVAPTASGDAQSPVADRVAPEGQSSAGASVTPPVGGTPRRHRTTKPKQNPHAERIEEIDQILNLKNAPIYSIIIKTNNGAEAIFDDIFRLLRQWRRSLTSRNDLRTDPPTLERCKALFEELGYAQYAEPFFWHYESAGWVKSSGGAIASLEATARRWIHTTPQYANGQQPRGESITAEDGAF